MSNILEDGPLRRILRERRKKFLSQQKAEETIRRWRERGVPEPAIDLAMKMADRWLKAVTR